jgi:hypothetical protein
LLDVCAGVNHCRAVHLSVVARAISISTVLPLGTAAGSVMVSGLP